MEISIDVAFAKACQQLGEAQVELALLREELGRVIAERDEAGQRILELINNQEIEGA